MLSMEKSSMRDDDDLEEENPKPVHHRIPNFIAAFLPAHKVIIQNSIEFCFQEILGIPLLCSR